MYATSSSYRGNATVLPARQAIVHYTWCLPQSCMCTDMYTALDAMDVQYTCSVQCMHAIACVVHVCARTHTHTTTLSAKHLHVYTWPESQRVIQEWSVSASLKI